VTQQAERTTLVQLGDGETDVGIDVGIDEGIDAVVVDERT
jgi:hypothetical protein